jgi:hypothetical protein
VHLRYACARHGLFFKDFKDTVWATAGRTAEFFNEYVLHDGVRDLGCVVKEAGKFDLHGSREDSGAGTYRLSEKKRLEEEGQDEV